MEEITLTPTFTDWIRNPTYEAEDEYFFYHADGSMTGKPIKDVFIYSNKID